MASAQKRTDRPTAEGGKRSLRLTAPRCGECVISELRSNQPGASGARSLSVEKRRRTLVYRTMSDQARRT